MALVLGLGAVQDSYNKVIYYNLKKHFAYRLFVHRLVPFGI